MRILFVSQYFHPEPFRINDLVEGMIERGHTVKVLTGLPNYPEGAVYSGYGPCGPWSEKFHGADVVRVPMIMRGKGGGVRLALNYFSFALSASLFGRLRCREYYDAIFVFEPSPITVAIPALAISRRRKTPVLLWVQDLWPESLTATNAVRSTVILDAVEKLVRWIYRHCTLILVQSDAFIDSIKALGVDESKIRYFPNTAEAFYRPVAIDTSVGVSQLPDGFKVMFAGNIGTAQSFETIVSAADLLRGQNHIKWIIVGDGRKANWVAEEIKKRNLGETVLMMGRHSMDSMPHWFAHADIMLVSLRKDPIFAQTIPAKVQSYLACGKPIVAALEGEGAKVINDSGAGVAVPPEHPEALADAVLKFSKTSPAGLAEIGRRGRDYFEAHFERGLLLDNLEAWLRAITKIEVI